MVSRAESKVGLYVAILIILGIVFLMPKAIVGLVTMNIENSVPAPEQFHMDYMLIGMTVGVLLIAGAGVYSTRRLSGNRDSANTLNMIIGKINADLGGGDRESALEDYKLFSKLFSKYKEKLSSEDSKRLYNQGIEIYQKLCN